MNNKKLIGDRDLPFESHWKNELWKQRQTNYIGPTSFPTLQNPFIQPMPEDPCLCVSGKLRVMVERKHRVAVGVGLGRGCPEEVGAAWRRALKEIFDLGNSIRLIYGSPRKWGWKFSSQFDRQRLFRVVACTGVKTSQALVLACPAFLTTWVSVNRDSALPTSSHSSLFINPAYLHKKRIIPPSFFCPLIFCTIEAITICSYKAIWDTHINKNKKYFTKTCPAHTHN